MKFPEAQILALVIQAKGVETEVIAMQAKDKLAPNPMLRYPPSAYFDKAQQLHTIANDIYNLGSNGGLE